MSQIFKLRSKFKPAGDQAPAIDKLVENISGDVKHQTLWGITGSGKTFTMANVIEKIQRPTLIIAHNKTLAAQLADEFREFFPENAVHYFVSYYDYYQPEAYIPHSDTYIEKDSSINDEIDRLRHAATHALLTSKDVVIIASVSCIYGIGSPKFYQAENYKFIDGEKANRDEFLHSLLSLQFQRNDTELKRGTFSLRGDTLEIFPAYANNTIRIEFFGNIVEKISEVDRVNGKIVGTLKEFEVFPAKHFVTPEESQREAILKMKRDLEIEVNNFKNAGKLIEAQRLEQRTNFDIEMIEETGYCSGIENYSRYFDGRRIGQPPSTLIDYFPSDYLMFIDESHITVPQIRAMYFGDLSRKQKLVDYGFRLQAAYDNRPLKFNEFYKKIRQVVFTSATPSEYEITKSTSENYVGDKPQKKQAVVKQFIRPTGLLDPEIEVRRTKGQIENLIKEIKLRVEKNQRVLVATLTKRMAEALTEYLEENKNKVAYLHSDVDTLERIKILNSLRLGEFDVLVGINLLREGLDLPEVSLVVILDADKEGFLRSKTSLIQTIGRAARHSEGKVIMYADTTTKSMNDAISETTERRRIQTLYNQEHNIIPKTVIRKLNQQEIKEEKQINEIDKAFKKLPSNEKQKVVKELYIEMRKAADKLEFEHAARLRDQITKLEAAFKTKV